MAAVRNALAALDQANGLVIKEDADDLATAYNALARIVESNKDNQMKPYTVVLMRPDYLTDNYGMDTYTAHVEEKGILEAIARGQKEAFHADGGIAQQC